MYGVRADGSPTHTISETTHTRLSVADGEYGAPEYRTWEGTPSEQEVFEALLAAGLLRERKNENPTG